MDGVFTYMYVQRNLPSSFRQVCIWFDFFNCLQLANVVDDFFDVVVQYNYDDGDILFDPLLYEQFVIILNYYSSWHIFRSSLRICSSLRIQIIYFISYHFATVIRIICHLRGTYPYNLLFFFGISQFRVLIVLVRPNSIRKCWYC